MGFRQGSYCKVWEVTPATDTRTKVRLSVSKKNKQTGEYEQDFGGYVSFVGTACASKAARLKEGDRIKLGDVDVQNRYDKEKNTTYYYPTVFSFDMADDAAAPAERAQSNVDDGEVDDSNLPY